MRRSNYEGFYYILVILLLISVILVLAYGKKTTIDNFSLSAPPQEIIDITGVEEDECMGHYQGKSNLSKCKLKLKANTNNKSFRDNLIKHNDGEICLTACIIHNEVRTEALYGLLEYISDTLKELKIPWVLYYGGLLGWFRDRKLIPWDPDLDILIPISYSEKMKIENTDYIFELYGKVDDPLTGKFVDKKTMLYCDIFYWDDKYLGPHYTGLKDGEISNIVEISKMGGNKILEISEDDFFPIREEAIVHNEKSISIQIPNNPEKNLKMRYGSNFLKPTYEQKNSKWYKT